MRQATRLGREFLQLWASFSCAEFGSGLVIALYPLVAAAVLHATPLQMGVLATANTLPYLLCGPLVGVFADRLPRRAILLSADLGRGTLLLLGLVGMMLGRLDFRLLFAVAFGVGIGNVWADIAHGSYLPLVVGRQHLILANSWLSTSQSIAAVAGPALAGIVLGALGPPVGVALGAGLFLLSTGLLYVTRPRRIPAAPSGSEPRARRSIRHEMVAGLAFIAHHPLLRPLTIRHVTWHFMVGGIYSQVVLFMVAGLHFPATLAGGMLSIVGAGTVVAVIVAGPFSRRVGVGPAIVLANLALALAAPLLVLAGYLPVPTVVPIGAALFAYGLLYMIYQINNASLRQAVTTDAMLGRVVAAIRVSTFGANAMGAISAGLLAEWVGIRPAIAVFSLLAVAAAVHGAMAGPLSTLRTIPGHAPEA